MPTVSIGMNQINTGLHANPFSILGVTPQDDRRKIVESAEERALHLDGNLCSKARADLTHPRARLSCEMAWLPGVAPATVEKVLQMLADSPQAVLAEPGLSSLALANLMSDACERVPADESAASLAEFMSDFADLVDSIEPEAVLRDVNADRVIAGFPEVRGIDLVEEELAERRRTYRLALKNLLDSMHPTRLIDTMTGAVKRATRNGEKQGSTLIEDLVDSYEVEVQGFLHKERDNITTLLNAARETAPLGETALVVITARLEAVVRKWVRVAQPILISTKSRGIAHPMSMTVGNDLRNLSVELNNTHGMRNHLRSMIEFLRELFAELTDLMELLEEDSKAIGAFDETNDPHRISFRAKIGFPMFRRELGISPEGVVWNGETFPLETITRVRCGEMRHAPVGTGVIRYIIGFGDNYSEQTVKIFDQAIADVFIERLWRAVCVGLVSDMIAALAQGTSFHFESITIEDDAVTLVRENFFGLNDRVRVGWDEVGVGRKDGCFLIGQSNKSNVRGSACYVSTWNVHLLEHIVRSCLIRRCLKLSDSIRG